MLQVNNIRHGQRWGVWQFDKKQLTLVNTSEYDYCIDLEEINSTAELSDWLLHIAEKARSGEWDPYELNQAFLTLFGNQPLKLLPGAIR